jgi:hypothetical protein
MKPSFENILESLLVKNLARSLCSFLILTGYGIWVSYLTT